MGNIIIFETESWKNFLPLSLSHPVFEMRVGRNSNLERITNFTRGNFLGLITRPSMEGVSRENHLLPVNQDLVNHFKDRPPEGKTIFLNGRIPLNHETLNNILSFGDNALFRSDGDIIGFICNENPLAPVEMLLGIPEEERIIEYLTHNHQEYRLMLNPADYLWDYVNQNPDFIQADFRGPQYSQHSGKVGEGVYYYNKDFINIGINAEVDASVVLDARKGPIFIESGAHIHSHSVILGPAVIGEKSELMPGTRLREGCSIGPQCRVGGEVEESIFMGYSNKYHEGFLGHSYLGEWVNLGALTTNSDLKNNYGEIKVSPDGVNLVSTGSNKVGVFIGDHSKLGIGSLINSGAIIGFCVNFYGGGLAPKYLPSFSWGDHKFMQYDLDKALKTARAVMARRGKLLTPEYLKLFKSVFEETRKDRELFMPSFSGQS
ncbi:hypothetical protein JW877_01645 [bacterium]|nr:hypothetical protein [bacterium]